MTTIDARGISCPEPLILLKQGLKTQTKLTLLVDSKNAMQNCEAFATKQGFTVKSTLNTDEYTMEIQKKS